MSNAEMDYSLNKRTRRRAESTIGRIAKWFLHGTKQVCYG